LPIVALLRTTARMVLLEEPLWLSGFNVVYRNGFDAPAALHTAAHIAEQQHYCEVLADSND